MAGTCLDPANWGACISNAAADTGLDVLQQVVQWCIEMTGKVAAAVVSWWVDVPTGSIASEDPIRWVWGHTAFLTSWLAVLALLVAAGRLAIQRKAEPAIEVAKGVLTMAVVSAMSIAVINLLTAAGDDFSSWIISQSTDQDFGKAVVGWLSVVVTSDGGPMLAMILALIATLACLAQVCLMLIRTAMLILLCGTLPMTAALSTTPSGRQTFNKTVAWLAAFELYKPIAAIIYATAFRMMAALETDKSSGGLVVSVAGIALMVLSVVALPALLRFVTPVVGAAGGGHGGGGVATMGALATGAKAVSDHKGGGSRGSGGPSGSTQRGNGSNPQGSKPVPAQSSAPGSDGTSSGPAKGASGAGDAASVAPVNGAQGAGQAAQAAGAAKAAGGPVGVVADGAQRVHSAIRQSAKSSADAGQNGGPSGSS